MVLFGEQEIESWSHRAVARARGDRVLPTIHIPTPAPARADVEDDDERFDREWRGLSHEGRVGWLRAGHARWFAFAKTAPQKPAGTVVDLDGRLVDGLLAFFCAIGEAINGPAGYFGQQLNGFADCAMGGFGIERPWTLHWHESKFAREALGYPETIRHQRELLESGTFVDEEARAVAVSDLAAMLSNEGPTLFDTIVDILRARDVTVELR
jgi:hypothetical protein